MSSTRTLVVVRHAKAESTAPSDHDRPLAPRGLRDASAAGEWLAGELGSAVIDGPEGETVALVSTATRARTTWERLAERIPARPMLLDGLYETGVDGVLQTLALLDASVRTALVVGHNPTMHGLVTHVSADDGSQVVVDLQARGFPTCALAVIDLDVAWRDVDAGSGRLRAFHVPRD